MTPEQTPAEGWNFELGPYIWFIRVDASTGDQPPDDGVGSPDGGLSLSAGGLIAGEARKGPWALVVDAIWVEYEGAGSGPLGLEADIDISLVELALTRRIGASSVEGLLGMRWINLAEDIQLGPLRFDDRTTILDPVVGLRAFNQLCANWSLRTRADLAGFGAGTELSWQVSAIVNYALGSWGELDLGYRVLDIDYDDEFTFDGRLAGPLVGLSFLF